MSIMVTIHREILVDRDNASMFALAQDYELRLEWDPFLKAMKFLNGSEAAPGVQVWVKAKNGLEMTVEYITVVPPTHVSMKMISGPRFFSRFSGKWSFEELSQDSCRIIFRYKYELKGYTFVIAPFVKLMMFYDMKKRLKYLKKHAEETDILQKLPV